MSHCAREAEAPAALVFVAVLGWLAATAWARPLMLPDEGRYVGVAWEMLRSGHWLTPTLDGLPYFHKPPLFYWITAGSLALFGPSAWAARMAPMLGATLGATALFLFVHRWSGHRAARLTLVALLAQPLFFIGGQFANLDMLVAGCITATILLLAHASLNIEQGLGYQRWLVGAYAIAAVGVLAKGLIGLVLPALVVGTWLWFRKRGRLTWKLLSPPGVLVFLLLAAPWFAAMQWRFPDFLDYFFVVQHFKRYAGGGFNNVHPLWYYPAALGLFCLPWLPWLKQLFGGSYWRGLERDPVRLLMLLWVGLIVLFFSVPTSKPLGYILPVVPPLAHLFADGLLGRSPSRDVQSRWVTSIALSLLPGLAGVAWFATHPERSTRDITRALAAQMRSGDGLVMLDNYFFDVAFNLGRDAPVAVVYDWTDPAIRQHDDSRKEIADAGRFAPTRAESTLLLPAALPATLCASATSWVIGPSDSPARYPFLDLAPPLKSRGGTTLWRVDRRDPAIVSALNCAGTPSAGSTDR